MTEFEPWTSGIGSDRSAKRAILIAPLKTLGITFLAFGCTALTYLSHFIFPAFPREPLVVEGVPVGADVDRLPQEEWSLSFHSFKNVHRRGIWICNKCQCEQM